MKIAGALLSVSVLLAPGIGLAHGRSLSYSSWELHDGGAEVRLRLPELELSRLPVRSRGPYLRTRLRLLEGDAACEVVDAPVRVPSAPGWAIWKWRAACAGGGVRAVESTILLDVVPTHLHFARVRFANGSVVERVLSEGRTRWVLASLPDGVSSPAGGESGSGLLDYVGLGLGHILSGWDHLAFVLALLLLAASLREVAVAVSGFTAAHSVTLGLGVLGVVRPEAAAVESLIALSILLVWVENGWCLAGRPPWIPRVVTTALAALAIGALAGVGSLPPITFAGLALFVGCYLALVARSGRPAGLRAVIAFAFGLVHGFGFAAILTSMELPTERLAPALFGFNLGVEAGQLAVVVLLWPGLQLLRRRPSGYAWLAETATGGGCALGVFWFVTRVLA